MLLAGLMEAEAVLRADFRQNQNQRDPGRSHQRDRGLATFDMGAMGQWNYVNVDVWGVAVVVVVIVWIWIWMVETVEKQRVLRRLCRLCRRRCRRQMNSFDFGFACVFDYCSVNFDVVVEERLVGRARIVEVGAMSNLPVPGSAENRSRKRIGIERGRASDHRHRRRLRSRANSRWIVDWVHGGARVRIANWTNHGHGLESLRTWRLAISNKQ